MSISLSNKIINLIISNKDILVTLVNVKLLEEKRKKHSPGGFL